MILVFCCVMWLWLFGCMLLTVVLRFGGVFGDLFVDLFCFVFIVYVGFRLLWVAVWLCCFVILIVTCCFSLMLSVLVGYCVVLLAWVWVVDAGLLFSCVTFVLFTVLFVVVRRFVIVWLLFAVCLFCLRVGCICLFCMSLWLWLGVIFWLY